MTLEKPLRLGGTLAVTVAVGYALCTVVFALFPDSAANFMTALFHGMDFRVLKSSGAFTFASFAYALLVLAVWAFLLGALFGWLAERFRLAPR